MWGSDLLVMVLVTSGVVVVKEEFVIPGGGEGESEAAAAATGVSDRGGERVDAATAVVGWASDNG